MEVVKIGAEALRQKAVCVENIDEKYTALAKAMFEITRAHRGVGLAGPQVGVNERMFVVLIEGDIPRIFINPTIIETSETVSVMEEGCLSIPGVWSDIKRPKFVSVQAWNERGRPFTLDASGLLARVIQHEYDHLEGTLFIDHLSEVKRQRLLLQYKKIENQAKKSS
ncbi:MAG: peptide deformylase [Spirochaetaceae bacterium]|jgi:peptide deformylase|nr:peptide deformylase [Spirochaetaceae bacterium]